MTSHNAVAFFHANAGYSYNPKVETAEEGRLRCAKALAGAERERVERGYRVVWEGEAEALSCTLLDEAGVVLGALFDVDVPSETGLRDPYLRVVEAQLALEALR